MSTPTPLQAGIGAFAAEIITLLITFGVFNNAQAASVSSVVVGAIAVAFLIANSVHHHANAQVKAAQIVANAQIAASQQKPAPTVSPVA